MCIYTVCILCISLIIPLLLTSDSDTELREDKSKYEQKGVEDEDGLRDIVVESENEEEEEKKDDKGKRT